MTPRITFDSNVLVYTVQPWDVRQAAARTLLQCAVGHGTVLTLQSLGEFFAVVTRKGFVTRTAAAEQVRRWMEMFPPLLAVTPAAMDAALTAHLAGRFSYWDALLVATAAEAGCTGVISEDMAPGATLGPVRIVPAFQHGAVSPAARALLGYSL